MNRRTLVAGLGAVAAGGTALVGSGAFSSVEAERTVTVETANDSNAYLRLTQPEDGPDEPTNDRSSTMEGQLRFQFPGAFEQIDDEPPTTNPENPDGLGEDTVYRFARESTGEPLFRAENQGTTPITIHSSHDAPADVPELAIFDVHTGERFTEATPSEVIGIGEAVDLGLEIDTHGVSAREDPYDLTLTIFAEAANA